MAVAPAFMADKIEILDDDDEALPPSGTATAPLPRPKVVSPLKVQIPIATHIAQSPFATAKKQAHVLQAENERLFQEFVEHCSPLTHDCPEVLTFLQTKHAKATPTFLSSVEFRNCLGRCLTRAQANQAKTFVYINELCTVLRQHAAKRRQTLSSAEPAATTSAAATNNNHEDAEVKLREEQPSTSGLRDDDRKEEDAKAEKKAQRASRKQIAYLENLLKVYNEEISRLQQSELSLDDLGADDSTYIQEHRLKRKMMKIYEKLCELKGCSTLTGRVIEQKIPYRSTRYPEINRRIERFINSDAVVRDPPDFQDILQQVQQANKRHSLGLSRKQLNQMAQEAFRETGSQIQERRHLDLIYNFGSHLTDAYAPTKDPALMDQTLLKKLRSNREVSLTRLEEVITKYAVKQEDVEEQERGRKQQKEQKEDEKAEQADGAPQEEEEKEEAAVAEVEVQQQQQEEEDDDEDDVSSDPDIEEEIQASTQQGGPDDEEEDEEEDGEGGSNEAEQTAGDANGEEQRGRLSGRAFGGEDGEAAVGVLSPLSDSNPSPLTDLTSPRDSPSQSDGPRLVSYGSVADSSNRVSLVLVNNTSSVTFLPTADADTDASTAVAPQPTPPPAANGVSSPKAGAERGGSPPAVPLLTRGQKRKREENHIIIQDSESDIPLDMGVFNCDSPPPADTTNSELVSSSQGTPPPKMNKVNVATQCDPDEIIVLSDSD